MRSAFAILSAYGVVGCGPGDPLPDCDHGTAYIVGKRSYDAAFEAGNALVDGDVLHLCAGVHASLRLFAPTSETRYQVEGEGAESTSIEGGPDASALHLTEGEVFVHGVALTAGTGSIDCESVNCSDDGCDSVCGRTYGGGLVVNGSTVVLEEVVIQGNSAVRGGGIASVTEFQYSGASIEIRNSRVIANTAEIAGAAVMMTGTELESVDTDWGSGVDDNVGGDVAVVPGGHEPDGSRRVRLRMDYEGVASFHCSLSNDWEEFSCE